ncbi:MAG: hypothetical protein JKY67_20760 [Pseudomonadales bacterium]|nr:hypothetical protein [Pseudomonadales bacterium]
MKTIKMVWISTLVVFIGACSANQIKLQSTILHADNSDRVFVLKEGVTIKASHAKPTTLKSGTKWLKVGSIDKGAVYRTKDQVVIVNSFNTHEGYIVVEQNNVVGYYLPIEKTFIETKPMLINFQ